jgi:hypothetical protein
LLFERKSVTASDSDLDIIVEDNARRPSEELVCRAVVDAANLLGAFLETIGSIGSNSSTGSRNKKR